MSESGSVTVDMGCPILEGPVVPTTLAPTMDGEQVVNAPISVAGQDWEVNHHLTTHLDLHLIRPYTTPPMKPSAHSLPQAAIPLTPPTLVQPLLPSSSHR